MSEIGSLIKNHIMHSRNTADISRLLKKFPILQNVEGMHFLSVRKYLYQSPCKYYSKQIQNMVLTWLLKTDATKPEVLAQNIKRLTPEINQAYFHLEEINKLDIHECEIAPTDLDTIKFIDRTINPNYLKLTESVFSALVRVLASILREERGKPTNDLNDLFPCVQELASSILAKVVAAYRHHMRNGIAHGATRYYQSQAEYTDKKGNKELLDFKEIIQVFDEMIDTCNGIALAISLFLIVNNGKNYEILGELLIQELVEETQTPWWKIESCIPSNLKQLNQLIIFANANSGDRRRVELSVFQTGVLAELFAPGFDRYFVSIKSPQVPTGWASFDGKKLKALREADRTDLADYATSLENNLIFYVPRITVPKLFYKFHWLAVFFLVNLPSLKEQLRTDFGLLNYELRESKLHRNGFGSIMNSKLVLKANAGAISKEQITKNSRRIIKHIFHLTRKMGKMNEMVKYLPLKFTRISIYSEDSRLRCLYGIGPTLVCTVQINRSKKIRSPDILGSEIQIVNGVRIAWNRSWLETQNP